jgi:hypothetical protein
MPRCLQQQHKAPLAKQQGHVQLHATLKRLARLSVQWGSI